MSQVAKLITEANGSVLLPNPNEYGKDKVKDFINGVVEKGKEGYEKAKSQVETKVNELKSQDKGFTPKEGQVNPDAVESHDQMLKQQEGPVAQAAEAVKKAAEEHPWLAGAAGAALGAGAGALAMRKKIAKAMKPAKA